MAEFNQTPSGLWKPAGQKLIFDMIEQGTVNDAYRYVITVLENAVQIGKFYITPNVLDTGVFDLGEVVRGRLAVDPRKYGLTNVIHSLNNKAFTKSNGNVNKYTVELRYWNGTTESALEDTQDIWLIDGYEQISSGLDPSFSDYYGTASTKKFWLTDREPESNIINITAGIEDTGVLTFINTDDTGSLVDAILINIYSADGSTTDTLGYTINTTNGAVLPSASATTYYYGTLLYGSFFPASLTALTTKLNNINGGWLYYDVIPTGSSVQKGNAYRFTNNCRPVKNTSVQLGWANTRGGWDYLRFDGRKLKTVTREEKTYRKQIGDYSAASFSLGATDREITPYQVEAKEMYQLNGILTSEEYDLFQYCFRSKNIMARIDGFWVPVTLKESSLQVESDTTSKVYIATINVELAQILRC
jgi:hypothetical protein